ncbi:heart- and neural crest derivatives-expressed protein 2-like [Antedon mediterranea]|uniref:heart- and neural crest derivatives-expressed protein 2-like n=1 Tax=Antedon mediterranea TaxID=105859 RepID=UPI003AF42DC7
MSLIHEFSDYSLQQHHLGNHRQDGRDRMYNQRQPWMLNPGLESAMPLHQPPDYHHHNLIHSPLPTAHSCVYEESNGPRAIRAPRRVAAKKERRRTQSINSAFAELRECIPNVPADTKLSKIKTLRLASSYIAYLTELLYEDNTKCHLDVDLGHIRAEFKRMEGKERQKQIQDNMTSIRGKNEKRGRGRTGWPEHVWALELRQ